MANDRRRQIQIALAEAEAEAEFKAAQQNKAAVITSYSIHYTKLYEY